MRVVNKKVVAAAVCVMAGSMAQAAIISWNLNNWGDSPTGASPTAGVGAYAASYWNDTWLDSLGNPALDLRDSTGAATTLDIEVASNSGSWNQSANSHVGLDADGSMNREMLSGYLNGTGADSTSVMLSQIPYAQYDIVVYLAADNYARSGTVTDGTTTYSFGVLDNMIAGVNAVFAQTTDTGTGNPEANYAVFSGLSGASQTISTSFLNAGEYGGIAGVQIVEVIPEPATIGLVGMFGAGVLFVRRRLTV